MIPKVHQLESPQASDLRLLFIQCPLFPLGAAESTPEPRNFSGWYVCVRQHWKFVGG